MGRGDGMRIGRTVRLLAAAGAVGLLAALPPALTGCHSGGGAQSNVLRYALNSAPTTVDPAVVEDGDTIDLLMQVFEGLVQWDDQNRIVPNIAEKWDVSPDGRTYTFHLKPGVKFHNGRQVKADDFVYSITRALKRATNSAVAMTYLNDIVGAADLANGKAATLAGVKALDDRTLRITIDKRAPYFLGKLTYPTAYVVCREAIEQNGGRLDERAMVGTGPFKLKSYQQDYLVTLVANPDYHGGKPVLAGIDRPVMRDSTTRLAAYQSNQLDIVDVPPADLERVQNDPTLGREVKRFKRAATWYLAMNQDAFPPFKDKRIRLAFACAIDKNDVIRRALHGAAEPANGVLPPGVPGFDPNLKGIPYDPARAKALLAEAGYPGGKGFPAIDISYRNGYKQVQDTVDTIAQQLRTNLGIDVRENQLEWSRFLTERDAGTLKSYHLRWAADYLDPQDFLSVLLHTGVPENRMGYSNPAFDRLCDQADVEPDQTKRLAMYREAERMVVADSPWVFLYFQRSIELHKPYVKGIRDSLMGHLPHVTTSVAR